MGNLLPQKLWQNLGLSAPPGNVPRPMVVILMFLHLTPRALSYSYINHGNQRGVFNLKSSQMSQLTLSDPFE